MKLFLVEYMDDNDMESELCVGESAEEVEQKESSRLLENGCCLVFLIAHEISEVDGYKIRLEKVNA